MSTATATATKGKQDTPLADKGTVDPIPDGAATDQAPAFDWNTLEAPVKTEKLVTTRQKTEDDIPERIRHMVEQALREDEYFEVKIPDEKVRADFVKYVRSYCFIRKSGRLTSRIVTDPKDASLVRYSVSVYKERKTGEAK